MYDVPSYVIAMILALAMLAAMWLGGATGRKRHVTTNGDSKSQANAVQGSLLGLLALLIGFTFSLSLGRYDQRSAAVVDEANAIGTAWLRTDLVSDVRREEAKTLLREYGTIRLAAATIAASNQVERSQLVAEAEAVFGRLWLLAADEAREAGNPVAMSFATSLNDMIDALATRDAAIDRHVPELVLFLLFGTFVLLGGVVGYSAWILNVRPGVPVYAMMILIVVLVFLIMDLDRPRRGLISVDQSKLVATVAAMGLN
ncbi:hypothetical protein [uncultured Limimaricola sp.]|uniref:bestrophin-like domain n=1 Tax=uncultured Limimaricola sp. TaxID=2211667 RepID=UPI0030FC2A6E